MKLNTDTLRKLVAEYATKPVEEGHLPLDLHDPEELAIISRPSSWKRHEKLKLKTILFQWGLESVDDVGDFADAKHTLCDDPVTDGCVIRHFVIADLSCDCTVISDPSDQRVLCLLWHAA